MSAALVNQKVNLAVAARESGDFTAAITYLESAQILLAGMPNAGKEGASLQWDRTSINALITSLRRQQAGAAGIQRTRITYRRSGACDDA